MTSSLLGGLTPAAFLHRHWQRRAKLVRSAIPGFEGPLGRDALFELAARDDVESRLVIRSGGRRWSLQHGPFRQRDIAGLPERNWTLLVQGVNLHDRAADELLRRFDFVSYARLDDLMVSYAAPGGGVGPHFDSYDVFLLQGFGRRQWRVSTQDDLTLEPALPLRILRHFRPEHEWVLGPGDMLYLPPHYAHDGVALEACTTWSIGFRAPSTQQLATGFLEFLQDRVVLAGRYEDPGLRPTRAPARISVTMERRLREMLSALRWDAAAIREFVGCLLTEPKPTVFFTRPDPPLSRARFAAAFERHGVRLDLRTQMLYDAAHLFVNGEPIAWRRRRATTTGAGITAVPHPLLTQLANARALPARQKAPDAVLDLLHRWYRDGYLHVDR